MEPRCATSCARGCPPTPTRRRPKPCSRGAAARSSGSPDTARRSSSAWTSGSARGSQRTTSAFANRQAMFDALIDRPLRRDLVRIVSRGLHDQSTAQTYVIGSAYAPSLLALEILARRAREAGAAALVVALPYDDTRRPSRSRRRPRRASSRPRRARRAHGRDAARSLARAPERSLRRLRGRVPDDLHTIRPAMRGRGAHRRCARTDARRRARAAERMLYNSLSYVCFFLAVLAAYWAMPTHRLRLGVVLLASWLFLRRVVPGLPDPVPDRDLRQLRCGALGRRHARREPEGGAAHRRRDGRRELTNLGFFKYANFFLEIGADLSRAVASSRTRRRSTYSCPSASPSTPSRRSPTSWTCTAATYR